MPTLSDAISDVKDDELKRLMKEMAPSQNFDYLDLWRELDRRSQEQHSSRIRYLTWAIAISTAIYTITAVISIIIALNK